MAGEERERLDEGEVRRHLALLSDVSRIASASLSLDDALQRIMAAVSRQFGPENWSVLLQDEETGGLRFALAMPSSTYNSRMT